MSKSINDDRKGYYNALEHTTGYIKKEKPLDITVWCEWFFNTLYTSLLEAHRSLNYIIVKTKFWVTTHPTKIAKLTLNLIP